MASKLEKAALATPGVRAGVKRKAAKLAADMKALAAPHGGLAADISVEYPNEYDVRVVISHPHIRAIEHGHYQTNKRGDILGYVPGIHVMRDAVAMNR